MGKILDPLGSLLPIITNDFYRKTPFPRNEKQLTLFLSRIEKTSMSPARRVHPSIGWKVRPAGRLSLATITTSCSRNRNIWLWERSLSPVLAHSAKLGGIKTRVSILLGLSCSTEPYTNPFFQDLPKVHLWVRYRFFFRCALPVKLREAHRTYELTYHRSSTAKCPTICRWLNFFSSAEWSPIEHSHSCDDQYSYRHLEYYNLHGKISPRNFCEINRKPRSLLDEIEPCTSS